MKVKELMTTKVASCGPRDTLNDAARLMWENDCGCVPVVDEKGCVAAMLTDRDICMAAYTQGVGLKDTPVSRARSKEVYTCSAEDDLLTAQAQMKTRKVRRLPVTDAQRRLVGIISLNDIAREAERERATRATRRVSDAEVTQTLGTICEPGAHIAMAVAA